MPHVHRYYWPPPPMRVRGRPGIFLFSGKKNGVLPSAFGGLWKGDKAMIVNQKELAQCLGISSRRVRQLKDEGLFQLSKAERGYILEKSIQEYIEYKVNAETGRRASISKEEVQAEHEEVKMKISLLKLRKLRRELHEAEDVEAFLSSMLLRFRNRLLAVPSKLAMEVAGETDLNVIMQVTKREMLAVLEELAEYDPDEIDGQKGEDDEDLEEDEDEGELDE